MQTIITSLVSALKRERAKNVQLRHLLEKVQDLDCIVNCRVPQDPIGTAREIIHHRRKAG